MPSPSRLSMPEISLDFRAPPPSPVASGRRSSFNNDEILTEFLETSVRVPDLVLPDKIFPKLKHVEAPPEVDFVSLCFHHDDALRDVVSQSLSTIGCFQLLNHGISTQLMASAADAAAGIFQLPPAKRAAAKRSPEKPWGFEEYHAGEEEEVGSEFSEEFVWCNDHELKLKMKAIWPIGYPNFSEKMGMLMSRVKMVATKILPVILKSMNGIEIGVGHDDEIGTLCCVCKHGADNRNEQLGNSSLKYDVIRMLIRGIDYSHALCLHVVNGSSEFHVYSKKTWLSFCPQKGALIITAGDQIQILSGGQLKHVTGRAMFKGEKEERISMAFMCCTEDTNKSFETNRGKTISLGQQIIFAIILTLVYQLLIYVYKKL